jgi:thiol:disulfide interchange protein DsbC
MLHSQINQYEQQGIRVRYVFFPRAGLGSESFHKAEAVWCSSDRKDALTRAKKGETLPVAPSYCKTPVAREYQAGLDVGVHGTPAIVAESGRMIAGYMPPETLVQELQHPSN